jgi:hypothetical protein
MDWRSGHSPLALSAVAGVDVNVVMRAAEMAYAVAAEDSRGSGPRGSLARCNGARWALAF